MNKQDDMVLNSTILPVEQQVRTTLEDRMNIIRKNIEQARGLYKPNIIVDKPLTTDIFKRGYSPSKEEIEAINIINSWETEILRDNPKAAFDNQNCRYYIMENGIIFKIENNLDFFSLDLKNKKWVIFTDALVLITKNKLRYSPLINFRDYYAKDVTKGAISL